MHPVVKRRLRPVVTIWPHIGTEDGDKVFGEPFTLKGFGVPKYQIVTTREGEEVKTKFAIIIDGADADKVKDTDEIATNRISRTPIKSISDYWALDDSSTELLEIYV